MYVTNVLDIRKKVKIVCAITYLFMLSWDLAVAFFISLTSDVTRNDRMEKAQQQKMSCQCNKYHHLREQRTSSASCQNCGGKE